MCNVGLIFWSVLAVMPVGDTLQQSSGGHLSICFRSGLQQGVIHSCHYFHMCTNHSVFSDHAPTSLRAYSENGLSSAIYLQHPLSYEQSYYGHSSLFTAYDLYAFENGEKNLWPLTMYRKYIFFVISEKGRQGRIICLSTEELWEVFHVSMEVVMVVYIEKLILESLCSPHPFHVTF